MKKKDIVVGNIYIAKVSGNLVPVRILSESPYGGWNARNERSGREIRIRGAQRLRARNFTELFEIIEKKKPGWRSQLAKTATSEVAAELQAEAQNLPISEGK